MDAAALVQMYTQLHVSEVEQALSPALPLRTLRRALPSRSSEKIFSADCTLIFFSPATTAPCSGSSRSSSAPCG